MIKKCLLIGQVANRARDINAYGLRAEDSALKRLDSYNMNHEDRDNATGSRGPTSTVDGQHGTTPSAASGLFDSANQHGSVKTLLNEVLGAWEEPKSLDRKSVRSSSTTNAHDLHSLATSGEDQHQLDHPVSAVSQLFAKLTSIWSCVRAGR